MSLFSLMITLDDEKNDVIRQLVVEGQSSLFDLHQSIVEAFKLNPGEMASFYYVEGNWEMSEEIPMEKFDEKSPIRAMSECNVEDIFLENDRLVYVYDFLSLWTFFIERVKTAENVSSTGVVLSIGTLPDEAPGKTFEFENNEMEDWDADDFDGDSADDYEREW